MRITVSRAAAVVTVCAATALAGGSGAPHRANHPAQGAPPQRSTAWVDRCFPRWEQQDMRTAAHAKLPVRTVEVVGTYEGPRVTLGTLAVWLGAPAASAPSAADLLRGWKLSTAGAVSTPGDLQVVVPKERLSGQPRGTAADAKLVFSERAATPAQRQLAKAAGLPSLPQGPLTLVIPVSPLRGQPATVAAVLADLSEKLRADPGGVQTMLYWQSRKNPPPTAFRSNEGPVDPAGQLSPSGVPKPACSTGSGTVMGPYQGRIAPVPIYFAMNSTVAFGMRQGAFFVESTGSGYDQIMWYWIPKIAVPSPQGTVQPAKTSPATAPAPPLANPAQEYFEALTVAGTHLGTLTSSSGTVYKGMNISLQVAGVADKSRYGTALAGNHAQILWSQFVQTVNGTAYMALSARTPPAASGSATVQYQYWVAVYRANPQHPGDDLAYCVVATLLSGTPGAADRSAVLALLSTWQVPAAN